MKPKTWEKKQVLIEQARIFRKLPTAHESILWQSLRRRHLGGFFFRRQHVIGPFIADFCCLKARVIVELEGVVHNSQQEYDEQREQWLTDQGFTVLRFPNRALDSDIIGVLKQILEACKRGNSITPSNE